MNHQKKARAKTEQEEHRPQKNQKHGTLLLEFPGPATEVIWALRAQSWKKSRKMSSRDLLASGPEKSKTESIRVKVDSFSTILTLFRLCFRLSGPRGRELETF